MVVRSPIDPIATAAIGCDKIAEAADVAMFHSFVAANAAPIPTVSVSMVDIAAPAAVLVSVILSCASEKASTNPPKIFLTIGTMFSAVAESESNSASVALFTPVSSPAPIADSRSSHAAFTLETEPCNVSDASAAA